MAKVLHVEEELEPVNVYDIEVEHLHTFISNGVVTHNCHRMAADQFVKSMWHCNAKLRLGMSATPTRKDGRDILLRGHVGPVMVEAEQEVMIPKVIVAQSAWRCPRVRRDGKIIQLPHTHGKVMHIIKTMAKCDERNVQLVQFIIAAYRKGRSILVFSEIGAHLQELHRLLVHAEVPEQDIGWYVGLGSAYTGNKTAQKEQRDKATICPIVLTTYAMCSEGTNIPWMSTCVLGTPRANVTQIVGRVRREYPDKPLPVVFDLIDNDSPVLRDYALARQKWYRSIQAPLVRA